MFLKVQSFVLYRLYKQVLEMVSFVVEILESVTFLSCLFLCTVPAVNSTIGHTVS